MNYCEEQYGKKDCPNCEDKECECRNCLNYGKIKIPPIMCGGTKGCSFYKKR